MIILEYVVHQFNSSIWGMCVYNQWRMQDWRLGGAEVIEMLICVKI